MIAFDEVCKTYPGDCQAVWKLSLDVAEGETLVLLGTSGSGKTTTMKMVNRLIDPTGGRIAIDGEDVLRQNPIELRRKIGYAIQHIGLFPHMTVAENIAVVPKLLQWDSSRIDARCDELLSMVGLEPDDFKPRYPSQLSGGQRQRIGVARALAADPPIVLMDEPFGALDPITREQLQNEFLELESIIKKTIIFVTHDVFEAVKMGDRIALLDAGRLQQLATPRELVDSPANEFVDQFLGQHRFQLSLLTQTIRSLATDMLQTSDAPPERGPHEVSVRSSVVDALDAFKKTGQSSIPIYDHGRYVGDLAKDKLLTVIVQLLGDQESVPAESDEAEPDEEAP